ncbi:MAG: glycosyltransferase [Clostridia bacterium]|nr:glycosyltransferase [Clostridia bacterium]
MKQQILYISSIPWNYAWHRQQEMMSKMAEAGFEVLFVQPCTKNPFKTTFIKQSDRIWLLSPAGLPYERVLRCVNSFNARIAKKQILKAMKKIGFETPIVWLDRVHGFDFKFFSKNSYVLYDLIDEILAFGRVRNEKMLLSLENMVLKRADLLISSSQTLASRKLAQCGMPKKTYQFIPNGVDISRFSSEKEWREIRNISHPRIGFIGTISKRRLDCSMLQSIIQRNPDWNFLFIGPEETAVSDELSGNNVYFFDRVSGDKIPEVVNSFDVGIIPYLINKSDMDYVFPRKACEFLASGKPVVSTPLPEMQIFGEYAIIASTAEEFEVGIKMALSQKNQEKKYREYVKKFDWEMLLQALVKKMIEREQEER